MARPISGHVAVLKAALSRQITNGYRRPGDRYLSARQIAKYHNVSYQTAHRLSQQLVKEGLLERRGRSGTFIRGERAACTHAELVFAERARRQFSFGARMLAGIVERLKKRGIDHTVNFKSGKARSDSAYPVFWDQDEALQAFLEAPKYALVLSDRPPTGLAASYIDTVETDDYCGGVCAAEVLRDRYGVDRPCVIGGPKTDVRSIERLRGFAQIFPTFKLISSESWFYEDGVRACRSLSLEHHDGCFCANDRLAQAFRHVFKREASFPLVGFDGAPIAEELGIVTVDISWAEQQDLAANIIERRLQGDNRPATRHVVAPRCLTF